MNCYKMRYLFQKVKWKPGVEDFPSRKEHFAIIVTVVNRIWWEKHFTTINTKTKTYTVSLYVTCTIIYIKTSDLSRKILCAVL